MEKNENDRKTDFIVRYEKILTREQCRDVIKDIDFFDENSLLFPQQYTNRPYQDQDAINIFADDGITLPTATHIARKIFPKIQPCIDKYLQQFPILGQRRFMIHDCKMKKIKCGAGFHQWHYENGTVSDARRTFVIQVYLNDDFDGGETEFLYQHCRIKPKAGKFVIFPCDWAWTHRGNPPLNNDKYIVTAWVEEYPTPGQ